MINVLTIVILVLFVMFGRWQLHRFEDRGVSVEPPDPRPAVALADLVRPDAPVPGGSIGRATTVSGTYDESRQLLVADRPLDGRPGWWVVTALRQSDPGAPAVLVARGWVAEPTTPTPPAGPVTLEGRLYASEDPPPVGTGPTDALPPGQYRQLNNAELAAAFPYRIQDGFVLRSATTSATSPAPGAATASPASSEPQAVPPPVRTLDEGGGLRNLAYALQWWLFAAAVLYFWWKLVRDELAPPEERRREPSVPERDDRALDRAPQHETLEPVAATDPSAEDPEDAELAAYNRYLAGLSARSGRRP